MFLDDSKLYAMIIVTIKYQLSMQYLYIDKNDHNRSVSTALMHDKCPRLKSLTLMTNRDARSLLFFRSNIVQMRIHA